MRIQIIVAIIAAILISLVWAKSVKLEVKDLKFELSPTLLGQRSIHDA
jgi:hypothetical protein